MTDFGQARGDVGIQFEQMSRLSLLMLGNLLRDASGRKRRVASKREVQRTTEAVNVSTMIDRMTVQRLLGCQVISRAENILVVGYGIDYAQRNRNLPFIGKVRFT